MVASVDGGSLNQIGPYRLVRKLDEGGMGVVYEAVHETLERRVAIKVLHSEQALSKNAVERFFNEARAVNLIEHPSLVQISDFGRQPDGSAYLVMEFLRGESLGARLRRGRLATRMAVQVAWQIADALVAVHARQIIHRDLKPDNVMLVPEPVAPSGERVKILDFGIAKLACAGANQTSSDVVMGTPAYMSPEQCRGAGQVEPKSDVYSLGVMLFVMLTGRPPFIGEVGELLAQHMLTAPPAVRSLAPRCPLILANLVERLLTKEKSQRPAMEEVRAELAQVLGALGSSAVQPPFQAPTPPAGAHRDAAAPPSGVDGSVEPQSKRRQRRWQLGAALASVIFALGIGWSLHASPLKGLRARLPAVAARALPEVAPDGPRAELPAPMAQMSSQAAVQVESLEALMTLALPPPQDAEPLQIETAPPVPSPLERSPSLPARRRASAANSSKKAGVSKKTSPRLRHAAAEQSQRSVPPTAPPVESSSGSFINVD